VWLIGRDGKFVGQILMVFGIKGRTKKGGREKYSIRKAADEQECSKDTRDGAMNSPREQ
jgi:hypothetical protein